MILAAKSTVLRPLGGDLGVGPTVLQEPYLDNTLGLANLSAK